MALVLSESLLEALSLIGAVPGLQEKEELQLVPAQAKALGKHLAQAWLEIPERLASLRLRLNEGILRTSSVEQVQSPG